MHSSTHAHMAVHPCTHARSHRLCSGWDQGRHWIRAVSWWMGWTLARYRCSCCAQASPSYRRWWIGRKRMQMRMRCECSVNSYIGVIVYENFLCENTNAVQCHVNNVQLIQHVHYRPIIYFALSICRFYVAVVFIGSYFVQWHNPIKLRSIQQA